MKRNLKTLVTMGAIALSLTTVVTSVAPIITAYADEEVKDDAYWQRWAKDYEKTERNGVYYHDGICARIIVVILIGVRLQEVMTAKYKY